MQRWNVAIKFFEMLDDFDFIRFEPVAFLAGRDRVGIAVPIELTTKANGKLIHDFETHLWTSRPDELVKHFQHFFDMQQFALAST
jgi:hypothetical protein